MWPAFDLVNKGVFMELGSPRLIGGVPGNKRVQNGVSSEVYEGKREAKNVKKKGKKERKENEREEEKKRGKKKE